MGMRAPGAPGPSEGAGGSAGAAGLSSASGDADGSAGAGGSAGAASINSGLGGSSGSENALDNFFSELFRLAALSDDGPTIAPPLLNVNVVPLGIAIASTKQFALANNFL